MTLWQIAVLHVEGRLAAWPISEAESRQSPSGAAAAALRYPSNELWMSAS